MANGNKIASLIAKGLPGDFITFRGTAYRPHFRFVAHGISIERTPYKDTNYVWHLVLPFLVPHRHVHLGWSRRIVSEPEHNQNFFHGNEQAISAWVLRRMEETGLIQTIGDEVSLDAFIERFTREPLKLGDSAGTIAELAVATHIAGDTAWSAECVQYCHTWLANEDQVRIGYGVANSEFQEMLRTILLPAFDGPADQVRARLVESVRRNVAQLGFVGGP